MENVLKILQTDRMVNKDSDYFSIGQVILKSNAMKVYFLFIYIY